MALFLFLICTVASAVILTAATVAAGRAAAVDETDARYCAVSSAAELLAKELSGKTVTITRVSTIKYVTTTTTGTTTIPDANGNNIEVPYSTTTGPVAGTPEYSAPTYQMIVNGTANTEIVPSNFLSKEAAALMFGTGASDDKDAFQNYSFASGKSSTRNITLTGPVTGIEISGKAVLRESGVLELFLGSDGYQLQVQLRPKIAETSGTEWTQSVDNPDDNTSRTTRTKTTTKTSTIYWTVDSIRKVVATPHE